MSQVDDGSDQVNDNSNDPVQASGQKKQKITPAYAITVLPCYHCDEVMHFVSKPAISDFATKLLDNYPSVSIDDEKYISLVRAMFLFDVNDKKKVLDDVLDMENFNKDAMDEFKTLGFDWITFLEVVNVIKNNSLYFEECELKELNQAMKDGAVGVVIRSD